jgi:hypothetical protein
MIKIKDTSAALILFEEAATKQAEATEQGDYKTGNKCYDKIVKAVDFLKQRNEVVAFSPTFRSSLYWSLNVGSNIFTSY